MYEDITSETFQADGEFWEAITTPWDDYDDYFPKEELNSSSSEQLYEITERHDFYTE